MLLLSTLFHYQQGSIIFTVKWRTSHWKECANVVLDLCMFAWKCENQCEINHTVRYSLKWAFILVSGYSPSLVNTSQCTGVWK